ncbi:adenylate/guanylate cyclase domain-containing protein [Thermodesulfobacteriota bacterium]
MEEYNGRVVDSPGDNLLAEFSSAVKAVDCAAKIQKELKIKNAELLENRRMQFRIGINLGDVIEENGSLYGSGVNIAARIEELAQPGGIFMSRNAYDQVKIKLDLGYEYLGEHNVKNISDPVSIYRVLTGTEATEKVVHGGIYRWIATAFIIIIIAAGLFVLIFYTNQRIKTELDSVEIEQAPVAQDVKETPKTIAVLPFDDLSPENGQEHFALGLSSIADG